MVLLFLQELSIKIFGGYVRGPMPRKVPLPEAEIAICRRLKLYRERCDLPRRLFARDSGLDTAVIIRIELGRSPLRYGVATRITRAFSINPSWLATGDGPLSAGIPLPSADDISVDERELFSSVFRDKLRESIAQKLAEFESNPAHKYGKQEHPTDPKGRMLAEEFVRLDLREWLTAVPDVRFNELINAIRFAALPLVYDWSESDDAPEVVARRRAAMDIERAKLEHRRATQGKNNLLTQPSICAKLPPVNSQLDNLLAEFDRLVKEPGMKTELAGFLGAPLASVSRWLSGKREPGRKITLKMLHWVEHKRRQPNTLDSATNTAKGKVTRGQKGYETKPSSNRKTK